MRWLGKPHSAISWELYRNVWHMHAFQEFYEFSGLTGHVPPSQYALQYRHQVNAMLRGQRIEGEMLVANPDQMIDVMQYYLLTEAQQGVRQDVMLVTRGVPAMHDVGVDEDLEGWGRHDVPLANSDRQQMGDAAPGADDDEMHIW